jgi:hypothetical protein
MLLEKNLLILDIFPPIKTDGDSKGIVSLTSAFEKADNQ